jgi:hypothetical protein
MGQAIYFFRPTIAEPNFNRSALSLSSMLASNVEKREIADLLCGK